MLSLQNMKRQERFLSSSCQWDFFCPQGVPVRRGGGQQRHHVTRLECQTPSLLPPSMAYNFIVSLPASRSQFFVSPIGLPVYHKKSHKAEDNKVCDEHRHADFCLKARWSVPPPHTHTHTTMQGQVNYKAQSWLTANCRVTGIYHAMPQTHGTLTCHAQL